MYTERNKLYHGDCLELMNKVEPMSIDMILCDLPYGTTACRWDSIVPFEQLWEAYKRIIKPDRAVVLFGSEPFSSLLRTSNPSWFRYDWIWDKVRPSGFQIAKYAPMKRHEIISVFSGKTPKWWPIMEKRAMEVSGLARTHSDSSPLKYIDGIKRTYTHKNPQSILVFNKGGDGRYLHPTQKPVALFEYLIKTYTQPGELVLDNCSGSGTTAIACLNTQRDFILIEKDEEYYELSKKRILDHQNGMKGLSNESQGIQSCLFG